MREKKNFLLLPPKNTIPQKIKDKYKQAFDIGADYLIEAAARRGKWIDQSQSLNIFLNTTSGKQISDVYLLAWKKGLKTTYYLRTLAASGVEKSTVALNNKSSQIQELSQKTAASLGLNNENAPLADPILIQENGSIEINLTEPDQEKVKEGASCTLEEKEECEACQ